MENQINMNAIMGLMAVALLGGIGIAAKETISNIWAGVSFMLNPVLKRGKVLEVTIGGEKLKGKLQSFSLARAMIQEEDGSIQMILISELRKVTIKVLP